MAAGTAGVTGWGAVPRTLLRAGPYLAAAAAAGVGAASWGASQVLLTPAKGRWRLHGPVRVVSVEGHLVTVQGPDAALPGTWGLGWDGGHGQVEDVLWAEPAGDGEQRATRPFRLLEGGEPGAGVEARWDPHVWPDRPEALGLDWAEDPVEGPVCPLPAWVYPGRDPRTWAVFVHGRKSLRAQAFRALRTTAAAGLTGMVVSYRNDHWLPRAGRYGLGSTEWEDVEAALRHARERGAERFVLVGYSLGGGIVSTFLRRSPLAERVAGVVLDAPVLDWEAVLRRVARNAGVPGFLVTTSMRATSLRAGIDWRQLDHVAGAPDFTRRTLLVHGTDDTTVPVESSDAFARAREDLVDYHRVPGAGHVTAWNHGPAAYDHKLEEFLDGLDLRPRRRARPALGARHARRSARRSTRRPTRELPT